MSKLSTLFLIPVLAISLLAPVTSASSKELTAPANVSELYCGTSTPVTLLSDKNINAGTVTVANGETTLFVTYTTASPWTLVKTDLAVANSLADIPVTSKGNPKVGQFPYRTSHSRITQFTYEIPLSGLGSTVYVAAHADVRKAGSTRTEGAWGEGTRFVPDKRSWGMYFTYVIQPCNQPPVAVNDTATVAEDSSATTINVLANDSDPDLDPFTIASASDPANGTVVVAGDGLSLTYQPDANYCNNGSPTDNFTYSLDPGGATATVAVTVTCVEDLPVAVNDAISMAENSQPTVVDVLANDSDAEGDPFTIASASDPANGTVVVAGDGLSLTYQPDAGYCNDGSPTDDFTYSLNPGGSMATVAVTVVCVDDAPAAIADLATVAEDSGASTINVLGNDFDPDGGSITIDSVTQPANGLVTITNSGADLTYQPNTNYCNGGSPTDDFTYTLTPGGSTATVAVTVTCVDDPATAVYDAASVLEDSVATTINVILNDTDIDGGVNSITSVTQPANGVVVITNGGADLTYQPNANSCNDGTPTDNFTYTLSPGGSVGNVAVTVTCVNDAPSFDLPASPNQTVVQDSGAQTVSGFATNISAGPANESGQTVTFNVSNDNTALFSSQPDIDESSGDLTYESASGATGSATVSVYLTDDGGTANSGVDTSATQTFTITVTSPNAAPFASDQPVSTNEDTLKTITLSGTDADGNSLTFSIVDNPSNGSLGSIGSVTCVGSPSTCTADVNYTPAADFNGSDSFTFKANDGAQDSNTATVNITVDAVNDAPSFTSGGNVTVAEDSGAYSAAWATGMSAGPADESGQTLSFNIQSNNNPSLFSVAPSVASDGTLSFTPAANANGTATLSVVLMDNGGTANGGVNTSAPVNFDIIVTGVNDAPVNTVPAAQSVNEDTDLVFSAANSNALSVADMDAASGNVQVTVSALNGTITPALGSGATIGGSGTSSATITGTLTQVNAALNGLKYKGNANWNSTRGSETLTIVANDQGNTGSGGALTDSDTVNITVNAVNDAPTAVAKNYNAQANMKIVGLTGLLTGATDPDTGDVGYTATFTVGTVSATTPAGGTISNLNNAAGSFDFDPPPGATGNVTFTYTVCDSGNPAPSACSAPATVTVSVAGPVIWFVNPAAGVNGDGRLSTPFNSLASAAAVDASGHRIFVYSGTATSGITLNSDEWLIGQGVTGASFDSIFGITPPAGTIARPGINGTRPVVQGNVVMATSDAVRGLNIQPGGSTQGLTASGATSLTVGEVSVTTTTGTAVSLTNSDGTFSFTSISANGAPNGIVWNNSSAATGSFTVNGDGVNTALGGNSSGGTISNATGSDGATTGIGIYLNNARNVTLRRMTINGTNQNFGIRGTSVTNFTMEYSTVGGVNGTSTPAREGSVIFDNLFGANAITSSIVSGAIEDNVRVENTTGTLTAFNLMNSTIQNNSTVSGNIGFRFATATPGVAMTGTVSGTTFQGNRTIAIQADASNGTVNFTATNNTIVAGAGGNNQGNQGIEVDVANNGVMNFTVSGNKIGTDGITNQPLLNTGINIFNGTLVTSGTPAIITGTVTNNTVYNAGAGFSGFGIRLFNQGYGTMNANVSGNTVNNVGLDYGIFAEVSSNSGTANATGSSSIGMTNNTANVLSGALDAIRLQGRGRSVMCARISGNSSSTRGTGFFGLEIRQAAQTISAVTYQALFNLEGLTSGLQTNHTTIVTYLNSQNPAITGGADEIHAAGITGVATNSCSSIP